MTQTLLGVWIGQRQQKAVKLLCHAQEMQQVRPEMTLNFVISSLMASETLTNLNPSNISSFTMIHRFINENKSNAKYHETRENEK